MKVDLWWTPGNVSFSHEPEEEFGEEVETRGHITQRALGIIAPFSTGHPRERAELGDGSDEAERPTMDATRRVIEDAAGRKGVSAAEEDAPMDAQFAEPDTWRPFTEDPIAFLNKIMPAAGLPTARVIGADQEADAYCQEIIHIPVPPAGPSRKAPEPRTVASWVRRPNSLVSETRRHEPVVHVERVHNVRVEPFIAGHERVTIQSEPRARDSHFQFWRVNSEIGDGAF